MQAFRVETRNDPSDDPPPTGGARVIVLDHLGAPVPGAGIEALSPDSLRLLEGKADENGSFVFTGLSLGDWTLTAFPPADEANSTVARESLPGTLTVAAGETGELELRRCTTGPAAGL